VIVEKNLSPSAPITYFYHNKNRKSKAFITISSTLNEEEYKQYGINVQPSVIFYYYPDANDRSFKETFVP
jgi:hypothetical protein